jgi:hypothetical protein
MSNGVSYDHIQVLLDKQHLELDAYIPEFLLQAQTVTASLGRNNLYVHENSLQCGDSNYPFIVASVT